MTFPSNPTNGQTYTDGYSSVWVYETDTWYRTVINRPNEVDYGAGLDTNVDAVNGVPSGGIAGQILVKTSSENYVAEWQDAGASYTDFYLGSYAGEANYPSTAVQGQWIIDSGTDQIVVWDADSQSWATTSISVTNTPSSSACDYPFQYVYSQTDGTGYGYAGATPADKWTNTPDGKIQAEGYTSDILSRRIKFATLQNPGDEVTLQATDNLTAFNRYCIIGLTKGTDDNALSWKVAGQPSSGTAWMLTDPADRATVELYTAYIEPYWGGTSYGHNLVGRSNSNGLSGLSGNQGELPITFKVETDYRIGVYIDGHFHVKTNIVPGGGVDLYLSTYGATGRTFAQPTGTLNTPTANNNTAPPVAPTARYFMSSIGTAGTELASGGGYVLYSSETVVREADVELSDDEAAAAAFCRVFIDYSSMTLTERAESTEPVVAQDQRVLDQVQYLARGYFHSLDLDLPSIQAKMALYADALAAANAGSVEATLELLQSLTLPSSSGGEALNIAPYYSGYQPGGTSDTRFNFPTSSQTRADFGITGVRFWGQGTSLGQMEFYFTSSQQNTALNWASQTRQVTFNVPGSDPAFEGTYILDPSNVVYQSGSQVTYSNPGGWNHVQVEALAQWATSNGLQSGLGTITLGSPSPTSPASALGEDAVVAELITKLQVHLTKFPR